MSIYYISIVDSQFFFTTDHIQAVRPGQNISDKFVPVTNGACTHQDVREALLRDGYTEIPNPDPLFEPIRVTALLAESHV